MQTRTDDPVAVIETRVVHDVQRRATTLLAEAAARGSAPSDALLALREFVVSTLRHHHEQEDRDLWVLLTAAEPSLHGPLAGLSDEHDLLDERIDRLEADPSPDAAIAVRDLLHEHLAREEPVLFPALRNHLTGEDWAGFSQRTVESTPPDAVPLYLAFFHEVATDDEIDVVLRHLPPQARALVPAIRAEAAEVLDALRRR